MSLESPSPSPEFKDLRPFQSSELQTSLVGYARLVLNAVVQSQPLPNPPALSPELTKLRPGLFVTLNVGKALRGCIGQIFGRSELLVAIRELCYSAAFEDPRFYPVRSEELSQIKLELSLLTKPWPIADWKQIQIGKHGIRLSLRGHTAIFLPQVAIEQGWDLAATLNALSAKAGMSPEAWHDPDCSFEVFEGIHFGEP